MTIQQKIGQMTQINVDQICNNNDYTLNTTAIEYWIKNYYVGSFLNSPMSGANINNKIGFNVTEWISFIIQLQATNLKYNNIPLIYGLDSVHGANYVYNATMFPHNIGLAATFNVDLAYRVGQITGKDTRTAGIPWAFAPVLGIGRQPLWSRFYETFGEDPTLVSLMGANVVKGIQGTDVSSDVNCIATMKHYTGYSNPHSGKDRTDAWIPYRYLRRYYLPSFKAAVDAGAGSVMINSGSVNGIPGHANRQYITDILIKEFSFNGIVVTDWQDIEKLIFFYHLTPSPKEAILIALNAGIDMSMVPEDDSFPRLLLELYNEGKVSMERIDYSVSKILQAKMNLGLFNNPYPSPNNPNINTVGSLNDRAWSKLVALESVTLLNNSLGILPLSTNINKILVTGIAANSLSIQNGGWSIHWQGASNDSFPWGTTIYGGIKEVAKNSNVTYIEGCSLDQLTNYQLALSEAQRSDVIILALGEAPEAETPGDINDLTLDANQLMYLELLLKVGKPVVLILVEARPRIVPYPLTQQVSALITSYLPSSEGGAAIAELLFGIENFSGRLPFTYPRTVDDLGVPYYHRYNADTTPLFEFGHGLSYTTFKYSSLTVSSTNLKIGSSLNVSILVENTGRVFGKETVMLYLSDLYASIAPEVKLLKRFKKIALFPGQIDVVNFQLLPSDFEFIGVNDLPVTEPGDFLLAIGNQNVTVTLF